ncbi:hypothetical protein LJC69_00520 [Bacteroidales bacterium OttesenSCG-928-K22]|nr:hypothetical protein [Bacteroidales bacterium OttesenSCG-928-K22]
MNLKFNIKSFALIILSIAIFTGCAGVKLPNSYNVTPDPLVLANNEINVDIKAEIPAKAFNKKATMEFTPVLKYDGKEKTFKTVYYKGEKVAGQGQVVSYKTPTAITYNASIPYEEGMENSVLVVEPKVKKGKKNLEQKEVKLADGVVTTYADVLHDEHLYFADRKTAELLGMDVNEYYEEVTIIKKDLTAYFQVNLHNLDKNLKLNKNNNLSSQTKELKKFIDNGWEIDKIEIKAYASPEGEEHFNEGLSERRAITGKKIINDIFKELNSEYKSNVKVKNPESVYKYDVQALGEDWNGFIDAVSASNINDKNIILNVVRSQASPRQKEQEIRNMTLIYDELKDDVLPPLRRVEITVSCFEPKKTHEEILRIALSKPESLMNKELLFAGTLTDNLQEKEQIYRSYAGFFPHDWKGNVNLGTVLLMQGKVQEAATYLDKANTQSQANPIIFNNMGARYSKIDDITNAKNYYDKAKMVGADVTYNKGIINLIEGNYIEANKNLAGEKSNFNAAVMFLANNDIAKAEQVLPNEDIDKVHYMKAVISARKNNKNAVIENLNKAFAKNSSMKAKAANDVEFIKYRNDNDFKAITK